MCADGDSLISQKRKVGIPDMVCSGTGVRDHRIVERNVRVSLARYMSMEIKNDTDMHIIFEGSTKTGQGDCWCERGNMILHKNGVILLGRS